MECKSNYLSPSIGLLNNPVLITSFATHLPLCDIMTFHILNFRNNCDEVSILVVGAATLFCQCNIDEVTDYSY